MSASDLSNLPWGEPAYDPHDYDTPEKILPPPTPLREVADPLEKRLERLEGMMERLLGAMEAQSPAQTTPEPSAPPVELPNERIVDGKRVATSPPVPNEVPVVIEGVDGTITMTAGQPAWIPAHDRPEYRDRDGIPFPTPHSVQSSPEALRSTFQREFLDPMRAAGVDQNRRPVGYELPDA